MTETLSSFERVKTFISEMSNVPPLEWGHFLLNLRLVQLKKGERLFSAGEKSTVVGYVTRGLIYTFYLTEDGKSVVKNFAWEGRLISPYSDLLQGRASTFTAEALEPCTVVVFDGSKLAEFQSRHVCWERLTRKCAERIVFERERREYESLAFSLEKQIASFYEQYAPIVGRIPQYLIARYLGITPVALSRIQSRKVQALEHNGL